MINSANERIRDRYYDIFRTRDLTYLGDIMHPKYTLQGKAKSLDDLPGWFETAWAGVVGDVDVTIEDSIAEKDRVATRVTMRWNNGQTDITGRYIAIHRFEESKIVEHWYYGERE